MRIEKLTITRADDVALVFGPINDVKSAIIIGDQTKSAWLKAISFALGYSNEIDNLSQEFHNFNGSVEIILNIEHNESMDAFLKNINTGIMQQKISLRRSIQSQQFGYFLGGTRVERVDVKNFLQLLGFAQSYPFQYAIQSNDISTVEMSNDKDRFELLKNCCGVAEFCSKRDKSLRVLKETEEQIQKIDKSLAKIDVQLNIFASNESQQIFHKWMLREKELGLFQIQYRIKKMRADREQLNLQLNAHSNTMAKVRNEIAQYAINGTEIRRDIRTLLEQMNVIGAHKRQLELQIDEFNRTNHQLEVSMQDLKEQVAQSSMGSDLINYEMEMYRNKMDETSTRMSDVDVDIEQIAEQKYGIEQELCELESQVEAVILNCQQNQRLGFQFESDTQRNNHLSGLIKKMKNTISRENRNFKKFQAEMQLELQEWERLKAIASEYDKQLAQMNADNEIDSYRRQQEMIVNLESQESHLMEESRSLKEKTVELTTNLQEIDDELRSRIGESIFEGNESMQTFMRKKKSLQFKQRYFGLVVDNFTCNDANMGKLVATSMGEYLFHHIVDTVQTASQIISELNAADSPGEVNFFVLSIIDSCEYDVDDGIKCLSFDVKFQKIFEKIYSEMPLKLKDLRSQLHEGLDAVSSLPGVIEESGAIIVIKTTSDINSMELYQQQQNLLELNESTRYEVKENSYRMDATFHSLNETRELIDKQQETINSIQHVQSSFAKTNNLIQLCEKRLQMKQTEVHKYEAKVKELTDTKNQYEEALKTDLLAEEETKAVEVVQVAITNKKMELQQVNAEIKKLQTKRDNISQFFEHSRYSALEEKSQIHLNNEAELSRVELELMQSTEYRRQAEVNFNETQRQMIDLSEELDNKKIALRDVDQMKVDAQKKQEQIFNEMSCMEIQKKSLSDDLNRLQAIKPYDATEFHNPDILDMSEADIGNQLSIARHQLETYQSTNSFDMSILGSFKDDRADFIRRRNELTKIGDKITSVMEKLDANISTSIRNTFDDFAKQFQINFVKVVRGGAAKLKLIETSSEPQSGEVSEMVGIEMFARFYDIEKPFDELLMQERRVVSLVFIIGMQQMCPAPFYLFERIDELIVEPYLLSFVNYLNDLSSKSQIITTKFHQMLAKECICLVITTCTSHTIWPPLALVRIIFSRTTTASNLRIKKIIKISRNKH